jgi:hypothetical protein
MRYRYASCLLYFKPYKSFRYEEARKYPGEDSYTLSDPRDSFEELGLDFQNSKENFYCNELE